MFTLGILPESKMRFSTIRYQPNGVIPSKDIIWHPVIGYVGVPYENNYRFRQTFHNRQLVFYGTEVKTSYVSNGIRALYFREKAKYDNTA